MEKVVSKDGTVIAYDRLGEGPALIMVNGALSTRTAVTAMPDGPGNLLSKHFTVYAYDRRGRGDSGDILPYAVEREVEDIDALIAKAGGTAFVFGHSSGAVLALEAARLLLARISKLAIYEPPFIIDASRPPLPEDYVAHLKALAVSGKRDEMVTYFMTISIGMPAEAVAQMHNAPMWPGLEAVAPTLAYDGAIMGDTIRGNPAAIKRWASVKTPTLVMDGGDSPAFMHNAAESLARLLPNGQHRRFPGQTHGVASDVLAPALVAFFKEK